MSELFETVPKWLKKWGFPARHISNLTKMHGPGLDKANQLEEIVISGDCLLILCGDRGPGKTQIATRWADIAATKHDKASRYHKVHDLLSIIKSQFGDSDRKKKEEAAELLERAKKVSILVLDEWSELAGTDWEQRTLTNLIDHRYDNLLTTIIITNHKPSEAAASVGRSIWSRAEETGGVVVCDWESYRKQK